MNTIKRSWFALLVALLLAGGPVNAQTVASAAIDELKQSQTGMIEATRQYQTSTEELLQLQQQEVEKAAQKLEQLRQLVNDGLVAKAELEESEQLLAAMRTKVEATRQQITRSRQTIAELEAQQELARSDVSGHAETLSKRQARSYVNPTIMRYPGATSWSIANLAGISAFFFEKFGHALPTSAVGQSALHNQFGLDHRNAVDVALHPVSLEGKALISYLESRGIPFLAFRAAIPGVATGPHIHIGTPSHRLTIG